MANAFNVEIDLKRFNNQLDKEYQEIVKRTDAEMFAATVNIEKAAAQAAPVDLDGLKSTIQAKRLGPLNYEVVAPITYAPYVEFGTGNQVVIPKGFEALARQFYVNGQGKTRAQPFLIPAFIFESAQLEKRLNAIK